jgi:hypothetical protein
MFLNKPRAIDRGLFSISCSLIRVIHIPLKPLNIPRRGMSQLVDWEYDTSIVASRKY